MHTLNNTEHMTEQNYRSFILTFFYILLSIFYFLIMLLVFIFFHMFIVTHQNTCENLLQPDSVSEYQNVALVLKKMQLMS